MPTLKEWLAGRDAAGNSLNPEKVAKYRDKVSGATGSAVETLLLLPRFLLAVGKWALAGMPTRTDDEIRERLDICRACDAFENSHCRECGCQCVEVQQLRNKLALKTEKCPRGKWD